VATARSLAPGRGNFSIASRRPPCARAAPCCRFASPDAVPFHPPRRLCRRKTADRDSAGLQDTAEEEDGAVGVRGAAGRREVRRRPGHVARRRRVDEDGVVAIDELGTGSPASQAPPRPSSTPVPPYAPQPPPLTISPGAIPRCLARSCLSARRHPTLPRLEAPHAGAASAPGAASCPRVTPPPPPRATRRHLGHHLLAPPYLGPIGRKRKKK
jgi:hypothetical protein